MPTRAGTAGPRRGADGSASAAGLRARPSLVAGLHAAVGVDEGAGDEVGRRGQIRVLTRCQANCYTDPLPTGAAGALSVTEIAALHRLLRRAFQLSRTLPDALLRLLHNGHPSTRTDGGGRCPDRLAGPPGVRLPWPAAGSRFAPGRHGEYRAEPRQPVKDVGPRRGSEKLGLSGGREPYARRCLTAAEGEPVGRALQLEVEAVVGRGLSSRVIVTAASFTGLGPASSAAMRRGCSRTREAELC